MLKNEPMFKINNYAMYGLNRYRSFLTAPICDCGCGEPTSIILKTDDDVGQFCVEVLNRHECPNSAIFAVFHDGRMRAYVKEWDEKSGEFAADCYEGGNTTHMFSKLDGEFRFCCYNLIIEREPGQWMIES